MNCFVVVSGSALSELSVSISVSTANRAHELAGDKRRHCDEAPRVSSTLYFKAVHFNIINK